MCDVGRTGGPRWVTTGVRQRPGCSPGRLRCLAAGGRRRRVAARRPDHGHRGRAQGPRDAGRAPPPPCGPDARPAQSVAVRWCWPGASGSGAVVSQPAGCTPRPSGRPDPSQGGADPTSPRRGLSASRQGRPRAGRGRADLGVAGRPSCGRWLTTAPRWWTTLLVWRGWRPSAWTRRAFFGQPYGADPMDHRSGRPGARPAAGAGGRPHQAAVTASFRPGRATGWPRSVRPRWTPARVCQRAGRAARPCHRGGGPPPRHPASASCW